MNIVIQIIALAALAVGMIATWVRNGKSQSVRDGALSQQIKDIKETLDKDDTGLVALNEKISDMKVKCAGVTGTFGQKIKGLEAEVFKQSGR